MKNLIVVFLFALFCNAGAFAQSANAPAEKPASAGQIYRCGNQYFDKPCGEKGAKPLQITANVVTAAKGQTIGANPGARPQSPECVTLLNQAETQKQQARTKSADQGVADLAAKIETVGC